MLVRRLPVLHSPRTNSASNEELRIPRAAAAVYACMRGGNRLYKHLRAGIACLQIAHLHRPSNISRSCFSSLHRPGQEQASRLYSEAPWLVRSSASRQVRSGGCLYKRISQPTCKMQLNRAPAISPSRRNCLQLWARCSLGARQRSEAVKWGPHHGAALSRPHRRASHQVSRRTSARGRLAVGSRPRLETTPWHTLRYSMPTSMSAPLSVRLRFIVMSLASSMDAVGRLPPLRIDEGGKFCRAPHGVLPMRCVADTGLDDQSSATDFASKELLLGVTGEGVPITPDEQLRCRYLVQPAGVILIEERSQRAAPHMRRKLEAFSDDTSKKSAATGREGSAGTPARSLDQQDRAARDLVPP